MFNAFQGRLRGNHALKKHYAEAKREQGQKQHNGEENRRGQKRAYARTLQVWEGNIHEHVVAANSPNLPFGPRTKIWSWQARQKKRNFAAELMVGNIVGYVGI